jgi:putative copper export protein/methionine-rich copper-binding protein CopC
MHAPRKTFAVLLATALALIVVSGAMAHARLLRSNPEDGAVLDEAPREAYLWFDEPLAIDFSSVETLDADGRSLGSAALRGDPSDPTLLIAVLPELSPGVYSLAWRVLSNTDSHFTQGTLVFGAGQTPGAEARPAARIEAPIPPLEVGLRALNYATLAGLIGSLLVTGVIVRRDHFDVSLREAVDAAVRRVWALGLGAAIAALVVGGGWLFWQAGVFQRGALDLIGTRFGTLWLVRQGALIVALVALVAARGGRKWGWPAGALAVVVVAASHALGSHAAGLPERPELAVAVDALHLLAVGAWVGSIVALLVGLLPLLRSSRAEFRQVALGGWRRFGVLAAISVGVLAATGLYSAARQVASIDAWIGTTYGLTLAVKIGLFLIVGLAGLINSMLLHPRLAERIGQLLRRPAGWRPLDPKRLPMVLLTEAGLALVLFVAGSVLTAAPPARGSEFEPPGARPKPPSSLSLPADDLLVVLTIRPNKPGSNIVLIDALNTRRPPPADILRVLVRLTYRDRDLGTQTLTAEAQDADTYRLNTGALSLAGAWRVQVVVRRAGLEDSVADFDWAVEPLAPSTPPRPVVISNAPIEPALTLLAAALAVCVGGLTVIGLRALRYPA